MAGLLLPASALAVHSHGEGLQSALRTFLSQHWQALPPSALQMCDLIVTIQLVRSSVLPEAMSSDLHQLIVLAYLQQPGDIPVRYHELFHGKQRFLSRCNLRKRLLAVIVRSQRRFCRLKTLLWPTPAVRRRAMRVIVRATPPSSHRLYWRLASMRP